MNNQRAFVVQWKELKRWAIPKQMFMPSLLPEGWLLVSIGDLVKQIEEHKKVEADKDYKLIGVRWYGEGTFHRETVKGGAISATYLTPVIPNAVIYNRLFAWKGSFAVVPIEHEGHFVSNEFPQFIVDERRILPHYLFLFFMCAGTIEAVKASSIGSAAVSRNRFKEEEFLDFEIPLPPISTQEAIVKRWQKAQREIQAAKERVESYKAQIDNRFFRKLGLNPPAQKVLPKVFAVWWEDFLRWSVSFNQASQSATNIKQGRYPVKQLGSIVNMVQYGTSEKANRQGKGTLVVRMNNIVEGRLELSDIKHVQLPKSAMQTLLLKDGDILFNRTNSKELVGKCAVFHGDGEYVFASYLIRLQVDTSKADPDFIAYVINSPIGRQQIDALSRQIIGQANINSVELRGLEIPLPPLEVQRNIVSQIEQWKVVIDRERAAAEHKSYEIKAEVEALILGTKKLERET
jgi:type I restriction enzyme S subunit